MIKKRYPLVAVLFSIISPGLGFLYVGKPLLAVGLPLTGIFTIAFISWTRLILDPHVVIALVILAIAIWIGATIAAGIIAYRQGEVTLSRSQRWYFYIAFIVISSVAGNVLHNIRGQWFGYEPYRIPAGSMANTLLIGDFIMVDTWKYRSSAPNRGEIVVFRFPQDPSIYYTKRVIGVPGDQIVIRAGVVYVNGKQLQETYANSEFNKRSSQGTSSYQVTPDGYFVLGDNRDNSNDSRYWGFVPVENITGRVEYIWFSWDPKSGVRADRIGKNVN